MRVTHKGCVHLDDLVQWSTFVFAAIEVERSVPVFRSVCVKQAEQPQKYTSETRLMALWGVLQGAVIENKSRPKERALNVKSRSSLQTLVCVDNTSVLLAADAVQWLQ